MVLSEDSIYLFLVDSLSISPSAFWNEFYNSKDYDNAKRLSNAIRKQTKIKSGNGFLRDYNDESVDAWGSYSETKWNGSDDLENSIFNFVNSFQKECLKLENGTPKFRIDKLELWQKTTLELGEDLFVTSMLANNHVKFGDFPTDLQWNYIIRSDFSALNNLIKNEKLVENHHHLWGAAPYMDLSWLYIMNNPVGLTEKFDALLEKKVSYSESLTSYEETTSLNLKDLVRAAAYIRLYLYKKCVLDENPSEKSRYGIIEIINSICNGDYVIENDDFVHEINYYKVINRYKIEDNAIDYAIDCELADYNKTCIDISGERGIYYNSLCKIFSNEECAFIQLLFYFYLLIKHQFDEIFIQKNHKYGFVNFKEYSDRKGVFIGKTIYEDVAIKMAINDNMEENEIIKLETRITSKNKQEELAKDIKYYEDKINGSTERHDGHFYVLHCPKEKKISWTNNNNILSCRESGLVEKIKESAIALNDLRQSNNEQAFLVYGIDACSTEVNCRPEYFGTAFRYLTGPRNYYDEILCQDKSMPNLKKTYHVGEDFYDITDGLRAIDEAIMFLELGHGDRIGHGVALGLDVGKYYSKHRTIVLLKQNKLDNLAWILNKIQEWNIDITTAYHERLRANFERLFLELYPKCAPDLLSYIESWKLRGDSPECYMSEDKDESYLRPMTPWQNYRLRNTGAYRNANKNTLIFIHKYQYDNELKKKAKEKISFDVTSDYIELVKQLQIRMRNFVLSKGVAIESCPSSNFLISNLDEFKDIPTFNLFPIRESHGDFIRLNVSINTDDQGVFYTSLAKEYTMLAGTLRKETKDGLRTLSDDKILNWIEHLIRNSKEQCFKQ